MSDDPNRPVVLTAVANEFEAGVIVSRLELSGIKAVAVGEFTANFKAEAPGSVKVLVPFADLERARQVVAEDQPLDENAWAELSNEAEGGLASEVAEETGSYSNFWRISLGTAFISAILVSCISAAATAWSGIHENLGARQFFNALFTGLGYGGTLGFLLGALLGAILALTRSSISSDS